MYYRAPEDFGMNAINLIITVCAVLSPNNCEERHLAFHRISPCGNAS